MKIAERIVLVLIALAFIGGGSWIYFSVKHNQKEVREAVARGEYQIPLKDEIKIVDESQWREYYPTTFPLTIGSISVEASLADSLSERIKGLSETPFLPKNVVKLFAFGVPGEHSIWMKDMNYSLDIIWAAEDGTIVHIEENISPETYPQSFSSPIPAWYVIEASAGFVEANDISIGDPVVIVVQ